MKSTISSFLEKHNYTSLDLKAVFFDMDGVLFDSMPGHAKAWKYAFETVGVQFSEYDAYLNEGRTGASTIDNAFMTSLGRHSTEEEIKRLIKTKSRQFETYPPAKPISFTKELAEKIKKEGIVSSVVTGSGQNSLFNTIEEFYPSLFNKDRMVTAFDVKYGKPNPEPYLMALEKANVQPHQAIVIENAPLGVQSGVAAGIFTIAVNTGILKREELENAGANLVFDNMNDLHKNWEKILTNN